jgi:GNAT superfamily N-acetyltransferase
VWRTDDFGAVALWFPPGVEPDGDAIAKVLTETVELDKQDETNRAIDQMQRAHPTFDHWYLPWLGVDPSAQGQGLGARLLRHCLTVVDEAKMPAYLETPNPRTIPFYERHGFEVSGTTDSGQCPPITFMLRRAQSATPSGLV